LLIKDLLPKLGDDVVMVSIDSDPNEDAQLLRRYADQLGFPWRFAIAPRELMTSLSRTFGNEFLDPTSEPMFAVSAKTGVAHRLPFGHKDEDDLREAVQRYRSE
jgi:cytochrome oxidase Cu insertion factor (SCO1/SenC/PrrC family)